MFGIVWGWGNQFLWLLRVSGFCPVVSSTAGIIEAITVFSTRVIICKYAKLII